MKKLLYSILALAWMCGVGFGASISTLTENFDDNSLDAAKWVSSTGCSETNQELEMATSLSGRFVNPYSQTTYALTGSQATIKIIDAGNQSLTSYQFYPLWLYLDGSHSLLFRITNGNLDIIDDDRTTASPKYSTTYSAVTHVYLRIRESSGTTYWDYSSEGSSWKNLYSESNPFAVTSLEVDFGVYSTAEASTTTAKIDDFNILPSESESAPIYSHAFSSGFNEGFNDGLN